MEGLKPVPTDVLRFVFDYDLDGISKFLRDLGACSIEDEMKALSELNGDEMVPASGEKIQLIGGEMEPASGEQVTDEGERLYKKPRLAEGFECLGEAEAA